MDYWKNLYWFPFNNCNYYFVFRKRRKIYNKPIIKGIIKPCQKQCTFAGVCVSVSVCALYAHGCLHMQEIDAGEYNKPCLLPIAVLFIKHTTATVCACAPCWATAWWAPAKFYGNKQCLRGDVVGSALYKCYFNSVLSFSIFYSLCSCLFY